MGLTPTQTLLRVELPLALPAIIAGIRIAIVSTIALATSPRSCSRRGSASRSSTRSRRTSRRDHRRGRARRRARVAADGAARLAQRALTPWAQVRRARCRCCSPSSGPSSTRSASSATTGRSSREDGRAPRALRRCDGVALLIALPLGVWLGHLHRGSFVAINVGNIGRALPSLAVIAFGLAFLGIGFTNVMVALVILAVPPILTNAYTAMDGVERDVVEAARGMGMSGLQMLTRVELPLALPLMFAGIRTSSVYVVATATIAAIAGGGGLGEIIVNQASYRLEGVIGAALCVCARLRGRLLLALVQRQ